MEMLGRDFLCFTILSQLVNFILLTLSSGLLGSLGKGQGTAPPPPNESVSPGLLLFEKRGKGRGWLLLEGSGSDAAPRPGKFVNRSGVRNPRKGWCPPNVSWWLSAVPLAFQLF